MKNSKTRPKPMFDLSSLREIKKNVTCSIPEEIDEMIFECAIKTGRTKKKEAELRLEDHVRRFSSIEQVGVVTERKLPE